MNDVAARYDLEDRNGILSIILHGDWISSCLDSVPERLLAEAREASGAVRIDVQNLGRLDTSGVFAIFRALGENRDVTVEPDTRSDIATLSKLVAPALEAEPARPKRGGITLWFEDFGRTVSSIGHNAYREQAFIGRLVVSLGRTVAHPRRLRTKALVATMQQAGLGGLPIVLIMTFFIGAVLALVGSTMLQTLGVTVYSVELVGIGILREFGAVVAAILFAGRSASAFTAQLGSMRMNQEIDAMRVMGVDIFDALVVPRVLAAVIMLPLMTVVADVGGLAGGMLVAKTMMGIEPDFFLQRLVDAVGAQQFWVGMAKVPLFALVIATTGCREGLEVEGDVESLGARVTGSVVQSIFLIIMFDALFAVLFRQAGL